MRVQRRTSLAAVAAVGLVTSLVAAAGPASAGNPNNSKKLTKAVTVEGVMNHLEAFQAIADANDGNREAGRSSVLFCYALGKAQRILGELARHTDRPVLVHGAVNGLVGCYREAGVRMVPTQLVSETEKGAAFTDALVLAPPSAGGSTWMRRFGDCATAFASGWMRVRGNRRRRGFDRGFVLSDHADWPELLQTALHADRDYRLPVPTLLLHGDADRVGDIVDSTRAWAARDDRAEYVVVPDAGHASNQDNPAAFNTALLAFLDRVHPLVGATRAMSA